MCGGGFGPIVNTQFVFACRITIEPTLAAARVGLYVCSGFPAPGLGAGGRRR